VEFFEKCEQLHNERLALNEVIQKTYGPVDAFFNAFEKNRKNGFWSDTACPIPYRCILGPEGNDIVGEVKSFQGK